MNINIEKFLKHINKKNIKKQQNKPIKIVDAITGLCVCGYMVKYPICTRCGRSYPNNIINKENNENNL